MWRSDGRGGREFTLGRESWAAAAHAALECSAFVADVDEELVTDDERSC